MATSKAAKPGFLKSCVQAVARWAGIPTDAGDGFAYNADQRDWNWRQAGQALTVPAVYACVSLLSDTISTLPLGFYRRTEDGRVPAEQHPLFRVLRRQPNADQTIEQLLGATVANVLLRGTGYWEKQLNGAGDVIGLTFLRTDATMRVWVNGAWQYSYTERGKRRIIPRSRLVIIPGFSLDGETGLSAIEYGARMLYTANAADTAAAGTFARGLLPTTVWKYPGTLREEQRNAAREAITLLSGAVNAGKPVILEGGTEVEDVGISPRDAQLLESRAFSVEEVCSWFRVQPFMIGRASQGQTNWGTGIEQQMIGFVMFALRPWLKRLESAIAKDCLAPDERGEYYAEFAIEGLLRGDSAARATFYSSALQNGWLTRNEVRRLENLPPVDGGDIATVQSALVPLAALESTPDETEQVRSALRRLLGLKDNDDES